MKESFKTRCQTAGIWMILIIICLVTIVLATESIGMILDGSDSVTLEQAPTTIKDVTPTGELYLNSSIQEDYIMSNDPEVQNIITTFKVNLGQNVVETYGLGEQQDCSEENLALVRQIIAQNNVLGRYAENLELKHFVMLCEQENKRREAEKSKIFLITLSEKCSYYFDFSDLDKAPSIVALDANHLSINYKIDLMKVKCQPQKIQFLSNVENFWAENADDRSIDQIKELLERRIIARFTESYREQGIEHATHAFKALFCALKYDTIVINGTSYSCQTH